MKDQAAQLRAMMGTRPAEIPLVEGPPALVVGSGKGGVGKSVLAVLAAAEMAARGYRVLLLDGAQNLGNLHVLLGVRPQGRLEALVTGEQQAADLLHPVAERVWLLPGDSGADTLYGLGGADRARLHYRLSALFDDFDLVLIDAGAGLEAAVRAATMRASRLVTVTAAEPTALTDAYALIKIVSTQVPDLPIEVIVNRVLEPGEGPAAFSRLATAAARFLRRGLHYLGDVPEDPVLRRVAREGHGLIEPGRDAPAWVGLRTALDRLELPAPAAWQLAAVDGG